MALARLLHQDADVLLLDEPTRGVDVGAKVEIYRLLGELAAQGKAVACDFALERAASCSSGRGALHEAFDEQRDEPLVHRQVAHLAPRDRPDSFGASAALRQQLRILLIIRTRMSRKWQNRVPDRPIVFYTHVRRLLRRSVTGIWNMSPSFVKCIQL